MSIALAEFITRVPLHASSSLTMTQYSTLLLFYAKIEFDPITPTMYIHIVSHETQRRSKAS